MKPEGRAIKARQYVDSLAASGRYLFGLADAQKALSVSQAAAKLALLRLSKQGIIATPARGFYAVVPPEYRSIRCLPADQFIPALMRLCIISGVLLAGPIVATILVLLIESFMAV